MKIKFLSFCIILITALCSASFAQDSKTESAGTKKVEEKAVEPKDISDIKTFDFIRVLADADKYFEAADKWQKVKCAPVSGFVCSKRECPKVRIAKDAYMILDKKSKTISLCRGKNCKYYPAEFEQTGIFINAKVVDSTGIYIRVLGDSRYKEISVVGLDAYITNGNCENLDKVEEKKK